MAVGPSGPRVARELAEFDCGGRMRRSIPSRVIAQGAPCLAIEKQSSEQSLQPVEIIDDAPAAAGFFDFRLPLVEPGQVFTWINVV